MRWSRTADNAPAATEYQPNNMFNPTPRSKTRSSKKTAGLFIENGNILTHGSTGECLLKNTPLFLESPNPSGVSQGETCDVLDCETS